MKPSLLRVVCMAVPPVILGESPVWDDRTQTLYWVDIDRGELHHCQADGNNAGAVSVGERLGCIALREQEEGFIAGLEHRIGLLTLNPLSITTLAAPEADLQGNRCNDGKCDSQGRFWVGTLQKAAESATGWLYRVDSDGRATSVAGPFICVNGPAFSPDGQYLYCVDSYRKTIYRFRLNGAGQLSDRQVFVVFEDPTWGYPDGLTFDVEGCLWVAQWGGSQVSRFSTKGKRLETIQLPVSNVTSCTFGGPELSTLFITTASLGRGNLTTPEPLAGALFAVDLDVGGIAANRYLG